MVNDYLNVLFQHLSEFVVTNEILVYLIVSLTIFCEIGLVIAPFLPGDSLVFTIGSFCASNLLSLPIILVLLILAAFLGETLNYLIGRWFGKKALSIPNFPFIKKEHIEKTSLFYKKYGGKAIFLARFMPILRTLAPFLAGVSKMNFKRFLFYNFLGGSLWVIVFLFLGFFFSNIPFVKNNFSLVIAGIAAVSFAPSLLGMLNKKILISLKIRKPNNAVIITLIATISIVGIAIILYSI